MRDDRDRVDEHRDREERLLRQRLCTNQTASRIATSCRRRSRRALSNSVGRKLRPQHAGLVDQRGGDTRAGSAPYRSARRSQRSPAATARPGRSRPRSPAAAPARRRADASLAGSDAGAASVTGWSSASLQQSAQPRRDLHELHACRASAGGAGRAGRPRRSRCTRPGWAASISTCWPRNAASGMLVGDEDDRRAASRPDPQQFLVQLVAGDLVERAERLVHQAGCAAARPAPARSRRAGACRRKAHAAARFSRPLRPTSASSSRRVGGRAPTRRPPTSSGSGHCRWRCARAATSRPGRRRLKLRASARLPAAIGRAPRSARSVMRHQIGDGAQQRGLAAAGRPEHRH